MRPTRIHWLALLAIILATVAVDQASKALVVARIAPGQTVTPIPALGDFFRLTVSQNTGAAFGFLPQAGGMFTVVAIIVSIGMIITHVRMPGSSWGKRIAMGLVIGGALGNVIDRLRLDYVIDFINYRIPGVISNVSNLADHAIVLGVLVLLVLTWRSDETPAKGETQESGQPY